MKIKTEEEMVQAAMRIANESEHSVVLFVVPNVYANNRISEIVRDHMHLYDGAAWRAQSREYRAKHGGRLTVRTLINENSNEFAGIQVSHIFVKDISHKLSEWIRYRMRSSHDHTSPMGVYMPHGLDARKLEDY